MGRVMCVGGPADSQPSMSTAPEGEQIRVEVNGQVWSYRLTGTIVQKSGQSYRVAEYIGPYL